MKSKRLNLLRGKRTRKSKAGGRRLIATALMAALPLTSIAGWVHKRHLQQISQQVRNHAQKKPVLVFSAPQVQSPILPKSPLVPLVLVPMSAPTRWKLLASELEVQLKKMDSLPQIKSLESGVEITFASDPIFSPGTALPLKESETDLRGLASWLNGKNDQLRLSVAIESHTDDTPVVRHRRDFASNWQLSAARAGSLAMIFETSRFPASHLRAIGLAASDPRSSDPKENRRIVIRLTGEGT